MLLWGITRTQAARVALALAGVLVFLADKLALMRTHGLGDLLLLVAILLFSTHTVAATRLLSRHGVTSACRAPRHCSTCCRRWRV